MDSGINILCFSACYGIALALECSELWRRYPWQRLGELLVAMLGMIAHTWYLGARAVVLKAAPLSSHHDWYLLAAWILVIVYLWSKFYLSRRSIGLFLLPVVLGLVAASRFASTAPMASYQAPRIWGLIHGMLLLLGTVTVLLGFMAGLMYLVQSYRLKHKIASQGKLQLPSLEWLERINSRSLAAATLFVGGGLLTGVIYRLAGPLGNNNLAMTDPVVWTLVVMAAWLILAEVFRLVYPAARQGRKVAYLTIAAFVFLVFVLAAMLWNDSLHASTSLQASERLPARGGER